MENATFHIGNFGIIKLKKSDIPSHMVIALLGAVRSKDDLEKVDNLLNNYKQESKQLETTYDFDQFIKNIANLLR